VKQNLRGTKDTSDWSYHPWELVEKTPAKACSERRRYHADMHFAAG